MNAPPQPVRAFRDQHLEFQQFARELKLLYSTNEAVLDGHTTKRPRLFAQIALASIALERFLRIIPGGNATDRDTLHSLLEKLSGPRLGLIRIHDGPSALGQVNATRRAFMHGRLDSAVDGTTLAGLAMGLLHFVDHVVAQIDPLLGTPIAGARPATFSPTTAGRRLTVNFRSPELELEDVRRHNEHCKASGKHDYLAVLTEGALTVSVLERCCRRALPAGFRQQDNRFADVLRRAVLGPSAPLSLFAEDPKDAVRRIVDVRNTLAHANYEQAVEGCRSTTTDEYFRSSEYICEVEHLYRLSRMWDEERRAARRRRPRPWR